MAKKKKTSASKKIKKTLKVKKKTTVKTPAVNTASSKQFLSSALREIEQQLEMLKTQKKQMERDLYLLALDYNDTQNQENSLRDSISKLVQREAHLSTKKTKIESDMKGLQEKITKVTRINSEMKGME